MEETTYSLVMSNIEEARRAYKEVRDDIRENQQFSVTYSFGSGHPITNVYTVEKLYPFYVLISHVANGTKIYDGYPYEDIYMMKRNGRFPTSMSSAQLVNFFGDEEEE